MRGSIKVLVSIACVLALPAEPIRATSLPEPIVDTGIVVTTPRPDPDLVVVRERYFGAAGVDLTPYGIGTGSDDFVQSIYFRYYLQAAGTAEDTILGVVTFPAGVRILGFITRGADLGASSPLLPYTASDALFAVATNPGDYESTARGFEPPGTGAGSNEFICQTDERSFVFGLDVTGGMDDFRVIVDYGSSFPPALTFQVNLFEENLGNALGSRGIRLGDPATAVAAGAGDYGEITHLVGIPLTTDDLPLGGTAPPSFGRNIVYLSRETGGNPRLDGYDLANGASVPALAEIPSTVIQRPRALAFGEDRKLYVVGDLEGLASIDPSSGAVTPLTIPTQNGVTVRMAALPGDTRLFILRQTSFPDPEDAFVDTYDTATGLFTPNFATFPRDLLPHPVDLVAGTNGTLYAFGALNGIHAVNPVTGAVTGAALTIPDLPGENVKATADPFSYRLYMLRDTSTGDTFLDSIDTKTGTFRQAVLEIPVSVIPDPAGLVVDNDGMLWVFGKNGGVVGTDPLAPTPQILYQTTCLDFTGFVNYAAIQRTPPEIASARSTAAFDVSISPIPGQLRFTWPDTTIPGLAYNLYQGTIGQYYSHAPSACFLPGIPDGAGLLYADLPEPGASVYFLITASDHSGEGSIGLLPPNSFARCGKQP